jgi:CrcB protein
MSTFSSIASIGIGATIGATCRYYIGILSIQFLGNGIPYGTLISNIIGSFLAGILIVLVLEKLYLSESLSLDASCWPCGLSNNDVSAFY